MIINGKHSLTVQPKWFVFSPHFDLGQRSATFHLVFSCDELKEKNAVRVTSPISNVHHIENRVYVETKNSLYELVFSPYRLDAVEEYLKNPDFKSSEFFEKYVPNRLPTGLGWVI